MTHHWDRDRKTDCWHRLWIEHLRVQTTLNPNHPAAKADGATDVVRYETAATNYATTDGVGRLGVQPMWDDQVDTAEKRTQHDLVAALEVFNNRAGASTAHMGLTSCDITDTANQIAIAESFHGVLGAVRAVIGRLDTVMLEYRELRLVARTHGQPAQLTTYGHRVATILGPLCDWYQRAAAWAERYPMRPPHGAVGTAADLLRVLTGWEPDGDAPSTGLGGQRSDSDGSPGVRIPTGASEGSGEAPGPLSEALTRAMAGVGRFEQAALKAHRAGHDVYLTMDLIDGRTDLVIGRDDGRNHHKTIVRVDTPPSNAEHLTENSLIGDTTYRLVGIPPVFDSSESRVRDEPRGGTPYEKMALCTAQLAARFGFSDVMDVTRQVYHRSYDLHTAALLAELASLAQTWAIDRRLESMLGLGTETPANGQVGSSSMPHKDNPRYSERMCALAVVTRCYLAASAETAGMEWLEGDVSTSAARRIILPGMFDAASRMVEDWHRVASSWTVNKSAIMNETLNHEWQMATGALMFEAVEAGMPRQRAHEALRAAEIQHGGMGIRAKMMFLVTTEDWPLDAARMRNLLARVMSGSIGTVQEQIAAVHESARQILD
jgi:adenylosuccinate lyase